jgi:hypothetical protein
LIGKIFLRNELLEVVLKMAEDHAVAWKEIRDRPSDWSLSGVGRRVTRAMTAWIPGGPSEALDTVPKAPETAVAVIDTQPVGSMDGTDVPSVSPPMVVGDIGSEATGEAGQASVVQTVAKQDGAGASTDFEGPKPTYHQARG